MTFQNFCDKINIGSFTEDELKNLWDGFGLDDVEMTFVEETRGEDRRWSHLDSRIYQIGDRYFEFFCDVGLTEYQEDTYYNNPREVRKETKEITTTITTFYPIDI